MTTCSHKLVGPVCRRRSGFRWFTHALLVAVALLCTTPAGSEDVLRLTDFYDLNATVSDEVPTSPAIAWWTADLGASMLPCDPAAAMQPYTQVYTLTLPLSIVTGNASTTGTRLVAIGLGLPCTASWVIFDKGCGTIIYPQSSVSDDQGLNWRCVSNESRLSQMHAATISFQYPPPPLRNASAISVQSNRTAVDPDNPLLQGPSCAMVCMLGGQNATAPTSVETYGAATAAVMCSHDGVRWFDAPPLPTPTTAAVAVQWNSSIIVIGGIRGDRSGEGFAADIDMDTCRITGWTRRGGILLGFLNRTGHVAARFPSLPSQWSGIGYPDIGPSEVMFLGGGVQVSDADVGLLGDVNICSQRVMVMSLGQKLYVSSDDGDSWQLVLNKDNANEPDVDPWRRATPSIATVSPIISDEDTGEPILYGPQLFSGVYFRGSVIAQPTVAASMRMAGRLTTFLARADIQRWALMILDANLVPSAGGPLSPPHRACRPRTPCARFAPRVKRTATLRFGRVTRRTIQCARAASGQSRSAACPRGAIASRPPPSRCWRAGAHLRLRIWR